MDNKNDLESFYYDILNISKPTNTIDVIDNIVKDNKAELKNIGGSVEGLCKVAANNISLDLHSKNIKHQIFNTNEILGGYEHLFIISYFKEQEKLKYVLIDPTYEQFCAQDGRVLLTSFKEWPSVVLNATDTGNKLLSSIIKDGYSIVDSLSIKLYLGSFINELDPDKIDFELDNIMINDLGKRTR